MEKERSETVLELLSATEMPTRGKKEPDGQAHAGNVIVGLLIGIDALGLPCVQMSGTLMAKPVPARSTVTLTPSDIGKQAVMVCEGGDLDRPIIIGLVQETAATFPQANSSVRLTEPITAKVDEEQVVLNAEKEIVLRCGKASITLTRAGKIIIRGAYLLSRSSGVNRIQGGSVQIN